jgi:hypothetical protein
MRMQVRALLVAEEFEAAAREGDAARRMHQQNREVHEVSLDLSPPTHHVH